MAKSQKGRKGKKAKGDRAKKAEKAEKAKTEVADKLICKFAISRFSLFVLLLSQPPSPSLLFPIKSLSLLYVQ